MKSFMNNNFKFVFSIIWFTFLFFKINELRVNENRSIEHDILFSREQSDLSFKILEDQIHALEDKLTNEFGFMRAYEYVCYEDIHKHVEYVFNNLYNQRKNNEIIDLVSPKDMQEKAFKGIQSRMKEQQ